MFEAKKTTLVKRKSYKYQLLRDKHPISYAEFIGLIEESEPFRTFFIAVLANLPLQAFHWETPPATKHSLTKPFEFVISRTPHINLPPNPEPFKQYFNPEKEVAVFDNLGGDAKLIAPTPGNQQHNYSHIGAFTKNAPTKQQQVLWQTVGNVTNDLISDQPIWLNTAGGGVAWLHVRLDSIPKYYRHQPYTTGN